MILEVLVKRKSSKPFHLFYNNLKIKSKNIYCYKFNKNSKKKKKNYPDNVICITYKLKVIIINSPMYNPFFRNHS